MRAQYTGIVANGKHTNPKIGIRVFINESLEQQNYSYVMSRLHLLFKDSLKIIRILGFDTLYTISFTVFCMSAATQHKLQPKTKYVHIARA